MTYLSRRIAAEDRAREDAHLDGVVAAVEQRIVSLETDKTGLEKKVTDLEAENKALRTGKGTKPSVLTGK